MTTRSQITLQIIHHYLQEHHPKTQPQIILDITEPESSYIVTKHRLLIQPTNTTLSIHCLNRGPIKETIDLNDPESLDKLSKIIHLFGG